MITPNNTKTTIYKSISEGINEFSKVSQINGYYFDLDNRLLIDGNVYTKTEDVLKKIFRLRIQILSLFFQSL